jgi:hypothetical protein
VVVVVGYSLEDFGGHWHQSEQRVAAVLQLELLVQAVHFAIELHVHGVQLNRLYRLKAYQRQLIQPSGNF